MTSSHFDVVVIGGGPSGYATALTAAAAELSVALIERDRLGGTCLHRGCIPAKELLETASVHRTVSQAGQFGIVTAAPTVDFSAAQNRKQSVVDRLFKGVTNLVEGKNIELFSGTGTLTSDRKIAVKMNDDLEEVLTGDSIVLAAGSQPKTLSGFEIDGATILSSGDVLTMTELPASALVVGGGAIGCEFASMLADLGTEVTILETADRLIPGADADIAKALQRSFKKRGIKTLTGKSANGHVPQSEGTIVKLNDGAEIAVEKVIICVGRRPYTDHLQLSETSVEVDDEGFVRVDAFCRTNVQGVYAVGDLIATPQLAHVGFAEAMLVVSEIVGEQRDPINYSKVPWAIYCHPEIAYAGLNEEQARQAGYEISVTQHRFIGNARALIHNDTEGMVKLVAERKENGKAGKLLGVHLIGPWATEQLGQGYLAVNRDIEISEIAEFIQPHPTLSELFGEATLELAGRTLHG